MYYLTPFTFISLAISAVTALLVSSEHHHHKSAPADPSSTAASDYTDHTDGLCISNFHSKSIHLMTVVQVQPGTTSLTIRGLVARHTQTMISFVPSVSMDLNAICQS